MDLESKYNQRSPAVKRIMREARELLNPTDEFFARPLDDNLFEWHFTVHGSPDTEYSGGIYHGRILLPPEYPMKPPNIILLTPNGRFETNKKICLSISGHHPETWQPSWSIRTALLALIAFMSSPGRGSIGALDYTPEERQALARQSHSWICDLCGPIQSLLQNQPNVTNSAETPNQMPEDVTMETNVTENVEEEIITPSINNNISAIHAQSPLRTSTLNLETSGLSRCTDVLLILIVAVIAFLFTRRVAISLFL